jgi:hypothetical protein
MQLLASILAAVSAGCGGGGHDDAGPTSFTGFVTDLATDTSDTAEPVPVNGATFTFSEDPHAFDALFQ